MDKIEKTVFDLDINLFFKDLNDEQKEAVFYFGKPQLVLSGAGSGKTMVLTYKIIYLLKIKNIPAENILAITFTNKAANEIKERIAKLIGDKYTKRLVIGTFHSIFCRILRKNIISLKGNKYNANFKIIIENESKDIIKSIIEDNFYDEFEKYLERKNINDNVKRKTELKNLVSSFFEKISFLKNNGITYQKYFELQDEIDKDKSHNISFFKNVYQNYVKICQNKNIMDFEDLLLNTFILFSDIDNLNILEKYQKRFQYVLVDEYQDTNIVQYEIIKAIAWKSRNIFVVGDDYQNIYSFRGANKLNISKFKESFPEYKENKLCRNYRSNSNIVKISNELILNNKNQIFKDLFSKIKPIDGKIKLIKCEDGIDEANKIAFVIHKLIKGNKCNYKDIAILYRMNLQFYPFKTIFFKKGIPHKITNGKSIFESKIIKIIYYYLQYIDDQNLDFCLPKILNFPKRNIGKETVKKLMNLSKVQGINCWEIINNCDNEEKIKEYNITKELQNKLIPFKNLITYLINFSNTKNIYETVEELLKCIKIEEIKEESKKEQINLLLEKVKEMEDEHNNISKEKFTLNEFLEDFSLLVENEEETDESEIKKDKVKLMTIHQAKGLEFKYVFIVGLEEGYYPCGSYIKDPEEVEEERRIFYVAITRAKINCYFSYAKARLYDGDLKNRNISPFLLEICNSKFVQVYDLENNKSFKKYVTQFNADNYKGSKKNKFSKNKHYKIKNKLKYNFSQKINFTKNVYSKENNNYLNNSIKIEKLNDNIIDIDENENENFENTLKGKITKKKSNENLNNKRNKEKKDKIKNEKPNNKFINKKTLRFKTIDSFFNPK